MHHATGLMRPLHPAGKHDKWNGVFGGLAAGSVIGLRLGSLPVAVGAGTALAIVSVLVETTGTRLSSGGVFDDGLTPAPTIYPYPEAREGQE